MVDSATTDAQELAPTAVESFFMRPPSAPCSLCGKYYHRATDRTLSRCAACMAAHGVCARCGAVCATLEELVDHTRLCSVVPVVASSVYVLLAQDAAPSSILSALEAKVDELASSLVGISSRVSLQSLGHVSRAGIGAYAYEVTIEGAGGTQHCAALVAAFEGGELPTIADIKVGWP